MMSNTRCSVRPVGFCMTVNTPSRPPTFHSRDESGPGGEARGWGPHAGLHGMRVAPPLPQDVPAMPNTWIVNLTGLLFAVNGAIVRLRAGSLGTHWERL